MRHPQRRYNVTSLTGQSKTDKFVGTMVTYLIAILCGGWALEMLTWRLHDHYLSSIPELDFWDAVVIVMFTRLLLKVLTYEEDE